MPISSKDFEKFAKEYQKEEKEILILTSDSSGGASRCGGNEVLWTANLYFLAYVDIGENRLVKGEGRVNWILTEEDRKAHGTSYPYNFKEGCIYRLKVRELADKTCPKGMLPSFFNRFLVLEVLEEDAKDSELQAVLDEYRKPVVITDKVLGKFKLNKDLNYFEGKICWCKEDAIALLEVSPDNKGSWTKALKVLRNLFDEQKERDGVFRTFAASKLTKLANDWQEEGVEISEEDFAKRISLSEISVTSDGGFNAYYNDDDMFFGHVVTVSGSIKKGAESANIEG